MRRFQFRPFLTTILGLSLIASACGSSGGGSPSNTAKRTVTVAGFNFNESTILMNIYGKALQSKGYTVNFKANLGNREIVEPALAKGDIDFYAGYAATDKSSAWVIRPIATTILRSPANGRRACATSMLSSAIRSPFCQGVSTHSSS